MKKISLLVFILFCGTLVFSQEQKTIKPVTTVKGADSKENRPGEKKAENNAAEVKQEEPVIIMTLEYTAPGYVPTTTVQETNTVEVKQEAEVEFVDPIVIIDQNIQAIDSKIEWVRSNPSEDKKARETGWYQQMEASKNALQKRKEELTNSEK